MLQPGKLLVAAAVAVVGVSVVAPAAIASGHEYYKHETVGVVTHGVSVGDVDSDSAVIWSRGDSASVMHVVLKNKGRNRSQHQSVSVVAENDFTGKVHFTGLKADTEYSYKVWFSSSRLR